MFRMKALLIAAALLGGYCTAAWSEETSDDRSQATVSRFVKDSTIAVLRIDAEKLNLDALAKPVETIIPNGNERAAMVAGKMMVAGWLDQFKKAGGREILILAGFETDVRDAYALVVPTPQDADKAAIKAALTQLTVPGGPFAGMLPADVSGGIALGGEKSVGNLLQAKETSRKLPAEPFASQKDAAIQVFIIPNDDQRRVIDQFLPGAISDPNVAGAWKGGLEWIAVGINTTGELSAKVEFGTKDEESAKGLNTWLGAVWNSLRESDQTRPAVDTIEGLAGDLKPKVTGNRVQLVVDPNFIKRMTPTLSALARTAKAEADSAQSKNALKQCALAMHNYHDQKKTFPPATFRDKDGKALLSWRVHVLPYIDQSTLYNQFHLDEPWDSEHNKKLIPMIPELLASKNPKLRAEGKTPIVVPVGEKTAFGMKDGTPIREFVDGTSNTLLILEVDDAHSVIWTKPDDLPVDGAKLKEILRAFSLADGSVRKLTPEFTEELLQQLATRDGKEAINWPGQ